MKLNAYLLFNGDCAAAFKLYEQVLGGKIESIMTFAEGPNAKDMTAEARGRILHVRLAVGDAVLMGSDAPPDHEEAAMAGCSISIGVDSPAEAERIYHALAEGGEVRMPIQETFWAARFAMLADRFGVSWMVNCELPA